MVCSTRVSPVGLTTEGERTDWSYEGVRELQIESLLGC